MRVTPSPFARRFSGCFWEVFAAPMGKSAKLHKRTPKNVKKASAGANPSAAAIVGASGGQAQVQTAKKKAGLKKKAASRTSDGGHVLGGADYVTLMMGGRKKARAEAAKLPQND
ncbi:hypothetical protein R3P38DRAFT_2764509 [Favolaschia claudopus]|uniref:Uncharacterized protein n=1 Tax=Favolaschia claudopus TaxID=2862362 RepID=A0AAW0D701_9AGAR